MTDRSTLNERVDTYIEALEAQLKDRDQLSANEIKALNVKKNIMVNLKDFYGYADHYNSEFKEMIEKDLENLLASRLDPVKSPDWIELLEKLVTSHNKPRESFTLQDIENNYKSFKAFYNKKIQLQEFHGVLEKLSKQFVDDANRAFPSDPGKTPLFTAPSSDQANDYFRKNPTAPDSLYAKKTKSGQQVEMLTPNLGVGNLLQHAYPYEEKGVLNRDQLVIDTVTSQMQKILGSNPNLVTYDKKIASVSNLRAELDNISRLASMTDPTDGDGVNTLKNMFPGFRAAIRELINLMDPIVDKDKIAELRALPDKLIASFAVELQGALSPYLVQEQASSPSRFANATARMRNAVTRKPKDRGIANLQNIPPDIAQIESVIVEDNVAPEFAALEEEARKELREASQSEIVREIGPNEEIYLRRAKIRLQAFESRTKLDFLNPDYLDLDKGQREALEKMKVYVNQELQNPSGKSVNELNRKLSKMFNDFPHSQASYRALYKGLNSSGAAKNITDQNTIKRDQNVYYAKNAIKKNLQGLAKVLVAKPKLEKKKPLYTPPSFFTNVVNFFRKKLVPRSIAKQAAVVLPQLDTNHGFNEKKLSILHQKLEGVSNLLVIQANFDLDEEIQPNENEVKKYFEENPTTVISVFGERHLDGSIEVYEIPPLGVGAMIKEEARYRKEGKANPDKLMSTVIQRYKTEMSEKDPSNPTYQLLLAHEKKILISDTMRTMLDEALVEVNELNNPNNEDKIVTKLTLLKNQMKELENLPKESSELRNMVQDISLLVNQMINALPEEIQEKIKNAESLPEDAVTTPLPPALEPVPPPPPLPVIPVRPGSLDAGQIAAQEGARQAIKLAQLMGKGVTSPSEQSTNISLPNSGGPPYAPAQQNAEAAYAQQAPTTTGGAHKKGDEAEPYVTAPPRTGPTTK
jgi:hypothetical protein